MTSTIILALLLASSVSVREGERSTVHLLEVARLKPSEKNSMKPPAKDGVRFVFVAIRKAGFAGLATLAETRAFEVKGQLYPPSEPTQSEPQTVLYDLEKFRRSIRPDLAERLPVVPDDDAIVIVVSIGGGELPAGAEARVKLVWGWNDVTEDFWFDFDVPH